MSRPRVNDGESEVVKVPTVTCDYVCSKHVEQLWLPTDYQLRVKVGPPRPIIYPTSGPNSENV